MTAAQNNLTQKKTIILEKALDPVKLYIRHFRMNKYKVTKEDEFYIIKGEKMFLFMRREKDWIIFTDIYTISDFKTKDPDKIHEIINSFNRKAHFTRYSFIPEEGAFMINYTMPAYFSEKLYKSLLEMINNDTRGIWTKSFAMFEYIAGPGMKKMRTVLPLKKRQEIENVKERLKQTVWPPMSYTLIPSVLAAADRLIDELAKYENKEIKDIRNELINLRKNFKREK